jgi:DNA-binding transcriptional regulator PaaX
MIRDKESLTKSAKILLYLLALKSIADKALAYPSLQKALYPDYYRHKNDRRLDTALQRLHKQGWIKTEYKEAKLIISLTNKGELESLFQRMRINAPPKIWDGSWRIIMFDIPEAARSIRKKLRHILLSMGYTSLQASVYVSPHPIPADALSLLKKLGLARYIRIARADFDDDADLRKLFKLNAKH